MSSTEAQDISNLIVEQQNALRTEQEQYPLIGDPRPIVEELVPQFPAELQALHQQKVKVQGWMLPLEPGDRQKHFLLSAVPTSCSFCTPAGPEGWIEVRTTTPVRYTLEAVTVEGLLAVLKDDPYGLFFRVVEGQQVP